MSKRSPKDVAGKVVRILNAWETLVPGKSFGGMTLEQYRAVVASSQTARQQIEALNDQLTQALAARDAADAVSLGKAQMVILGVIADVTEGPDSSLYATMGYTRKSERKSGLTRKKSQRAPAPTV